MNAFVLQSLNHSETHLDTNVLLFALYHPNYWVFSSRSISQSRVYPGLHFGLKLKHLALHRKCYKIQSVFSYFLLM